MRLDAQPFLRVLLLTALDNFDSRVLSTVSASFLFLAEIKVLAFLVRVLISERVDLFLSRLFLFCLSPLIAALLFGIIILYFF